jgi:hypothetical protein
VWRRVTRHGRSALKRSSFHGQSCFHWGDFTLTFFLKHQIAVNMPQIFLNDLKLAWAYSVIIMQLIVAMPHRNTNLRTQGLGKGVCAPQKLSVSSQNLIIGPNPQSQTGFITCGRGAILFRRVLSLLKPQSHLTGCSSLWNYQRRRNLRWIPKTRLFAVFGLLGRQRITLKWEDLPAFFHSCR